MATPRRSARVAALDSSPNYNEDDTPQRKRKSETTTGSSPAAKRGKKSTPKKQQTIEDAMEVDRQEPEALDTEDAKPGEENQENEPQAEPPTAQKETGGQDKDKATVETVKEDTAAEAKTKTTAPVEAPSMSKEDYPIVPPEQEQASASVQVQETSQQGTESNEQPNGPTTTDDKPADPMEKTHVQDAEKPSQPPAETPKEAPVRSDPASAPKEDAQPSSAPTTNGNAVEPHGRDEDLPSSILEKGIIYFFFRARVNISDPQDINDIARSYIILRPIPKDAKLTDGPIGDEKKVRLIALPKKVLPLSGKDRFLAFVEKSQATFSELKSDFLTGSDYATKTAGTSHTPAVTPVAEGVYAITSTGRESHLAYMITLPQDLGEVQKDVGIREQGSFLLSAKNPKFPSPQGASIGGDPGYSEEIMQEFRDLRWMPVKPKLLEYVNTQFLLIGESSGLEKAVQHLERDEKKDTEAPKEELEKLEGEDEIRVKHLKGDDAVFADLQISKKELNHLPTTWA